MKQFQLILFMAFSFAVASGVAQNQPAGPGSDSSTKAVVNPEAQSASIRILTPVAGQTLTSNIASLRFELVQPALSGEPNFLVQLDGQDPINTTSTDYTFSGLQPGLHTVRVTMVDANNSPVQGGSATIQFKVAAQPAASESPRSGRQHGGRTLAGLPPAAPIPGELRKESDGYLPMAGSPLPMISLIGFGLLLGGAVQTMRSRRA